MTNRGDRLICFAGAAMLGGLAGIMLWRMLGHGAGYLLKPAVLVGGLALLFVIGGALKGGWLQRLVRGCTLLMINTAVVFGVAEVAGRVIGLDYNELLGARKKNEAFPIYFRLPTQPAGDVFFVRHGPDQWTGKPLTTLLTNHRSTDVAYTDEKEVTITYDKDGFRNASDLKDWDVVVAGDSFTESGYLAQGDIFTGLLAERMGKTVKNLGVTDTGNLSHAFYLKTYGKAPACREAVLAFFEGNDLSDNVHEVDAQQTFQKTGKRPSHDIPKEPSLLKTLYHLVRDFRQMTFRPRSYANAIFKGKEEVPVTIADAPPSSQNMSDKEKAAMGQALDQWAKNCKELGVRAHLLYLPCKRRVLDGHLEQKTDYPEPKWSLGDLPQYIEKECVARGILFVDATPALAQKSKEGVLTYNSIYDTHFNAEGHRVTAEVLSAHLLKP